MKAVLTVVLLALASSCATSGSNPQIKLYVLDCGAIQLEHITDFGLPNDATDVRELFVPCYLIDHPQGQLLWDAGLPLSAAGAGQITMQPGVTMTYERSVLDQLADIGVKPTDVEYLALSHMHFDHAGAANAFKTATLLIQQTEHHAAFEDAANNPRV